MAMIALVRGGEREGGGKSGSFPAVWRKAQVDRGGVEYPHPSQVGRGGGGEPEYPPTQVCTLQVCIRPSCPQYWKLIYRVIFFTGAPLEVPSTEKLI